MVKISFFVLWGNIMIQKWAQWLPYRVLMWAIRKNSSIDGYATLNMGGNDKYDVVFFRMRGGEFVVFSKEIQDKYDERKKTKDNKKLEKEYRKLNKKLMNNYALKRKLKEKFEYENTIDGSEY